MKEKIRINHAIVRLRSRLESLDLVPHQKTNDIRLIDNEEEQKKKMKMKKKRRSNNNNNNNGRSEATLTSK